MDTEDIKVEKQISESEEQKEGNGVGNSKEEKGFKMHDVLVGGTKTDDICIMPTPDYSKNA